MTTHKLSEQERIDMVDYARSNPQLNDSEIADKYGVTAPTLRYWKKQLADNGKPTVELPELPTSDKPIDEYIDDICDGFTRRWAAHKAQKWMEFKVNLTGPIGLVFVGDPHVDDNGCNWPLLKEHAEIIESTEGMFSIPLGDYTNNWIGFLASKVYPHQEVTQNMAWKLAKWYLDKIDPLVLIKGNHDLWSKSKGVKDPLDFMMEGKIIQDWQARFQLKLPNGRIIKIHAAHDFKGNSMWNPNHGPMREEQLSGSLADIYAAGDKHNWICTHYENARAGKCPVMLRARGYKYIDHYAEQLGFEPQRYGASITCIIRPDKEGSAFITPFAELVEAQEYLNFLRKNK
jgi:hypothetical protein